MAKSSNEARTSYDILPKHYVNEVSADESDGCGEEQVKDDDRVDAEGAESGFGQDGLHLGADEVFDRGQLLVKGVLGGLRGFGPAVLSELEGLVMELGTGVG
jgi:hypothetical protein